MRTESASPKTILRKPWLSWNSFFFSLLTHLGRKMLVFNISEFQNVTGTPFKVSSIILTAETSFTHWSQAPKSPTFFAGGMMKAGCCRG